MPATNPNDFLPKAQRLEIFMRRLKERAPAASSHDEAMAMLAETLNQVEEEFSGAPYDPEEGGTDGRLYAPKEKYRRPEWERPGVRCYRQVAHATFVAENGAVEIRRIEFQDTGRVLGGIIFEKPGLNGRMVSNYGHSSA